ncbi:MAG TPA: response regulator [Thermoanaerobaculia bacterium]|nr:response regulator [Thermoanaerobaculia bacterium]
MGYRILLADDSLTIQKVVELTFARSDWELRTVGSGDKAAALLPEFAPDVVLADAVMPGLTGYELCEAVKKLPDGPYIPVIMLTGTFEPFDRARADRAGADAVVTKPFDSHALLGLVRDLTTRAKEEKAAAPPPPPPPPPEPEPEPEGEPVAEVFAAPPPPFEPAEDTSPTNVPRVRPPDAPVPETARPPDSLYATTAIPIFTPEQLEAMQPPRLSEPEPLPPEPIPEIPSDPFREAEMPPPAVEPTTAPVTAYEVDLGGLEEEVPRRDIEADIAEFERSGRVSSVRPAFVSGPGGVETGATSVELPPPGGPLPESPASELEVLAARTSLNDLTRLVGASGGGDRPLGDDDVERIARRVVEILGERVVRKVAWDVVPEMAERLVRERLRELERTD